jgi:polysaccharide biosynthesis PFTS motif protein
MCGDENVLSFNKPKLCKMLNIPYDEKSRFIAIFDVPIEPSSLSKRNIKSAHYNKIYSEEYNYALLKDAFGLLSEFNDLKLIYKPKRSLTSGVFHYSPRTKELFEKMRSNPNVIILDYNINPWVPLALGDMFINLPFGSATIAALHYHKPGVFYDPFNIVGYSRYFKIKNLLIRDYNQLKKAVAESLFSVAEINEASRDRFSDFVGIKDGMNSSKEFRLYLKQLAAQN